ncbi:acetyltransferase [Desulfosporosinus metallidurans]|uniref:4-amino-6-deoxy-N-Acetyl-D-hexosaminyl-(Lipid carrier) acetyltrasferase n=1 Tax=Desulfosporosinus metallidurans TaxID=1888891 RepID=A0A1Q8R1P6_9FIRM|nr:acetyltransferase [Desulfosporosinus metallidurans]OLN33518.1 4-amino-6-deoxy-N-Acetyl-D-hexosaminyl-(Lipid carrier) acetyltrasferase [Desulfosporosinus metallidurans]
MNKIVLVGAGGHALSVIDSIQSNGKYEIVGITDAGAVVGEKVLGYEVIGNDAILTSVFDNGVEYAFVTVGSIGNTSLREKLFYMLKSKGFCLPAIIDNSSKIGSNVWLGEGIYVGKNTVVNAKSTIGDMAIINTGAIIEHGCCIDNFTHIGPGAVICGDVKIGAGTHVGANATVIQGVTIGDNSLIGAGSNVVHDVTSKVIAYGNPCKVVRTIE